MRFNIEKTTLIKRLSVAIGVAAMIWSFALPMSASADPLGPNQAGLAPIPPEMAAIMSQKRQLSDMLALVNRGLADRADYESRLAAFVALQKIALPNEATPRSKQTSSVPNQIESCPGGEPCMSPTHKYLGLTQVPQWEDYYCGPASGYAVLSALSLWQSAYGVGESLSQGSVALDPYFETNYWTQTPWSAGLKAWPMSYGLNRWMQGTDTGWYVPVGINAGGVTAAQYQNDLMFDIQNNFPFLGNVAEVFNSAHLVGHPNQTNTIYHIISVYGYSSNGANTHYADSVAGTVFWAWSGSVPAYSPYNSSTLASAMLVHRGYVW